MARHFANWLTSYMEHTKHSESPDAFHFWTGVSTIAGALRRRVWIDMRYFQWTPNFYIVLVGPPGIASKSTTLRLGTNLLMKVDGIKFGPQSMTWQALTESIAEATEYVDFIRADGTGDTVAMSAVTCAVPELGTFLKMEDSALVDVLISMWDGQLENWGHKTKSSGNVDIRNPWLNLIGCTTPTWLEQNFPEAAIGGGLTSRIMFIYGDTKRHLVAYPDEMIQEADYVDRQTKLVEDLKRISTLTGGYSISPDARMWGRDWYSKLWAARPPDMANDRYSPYISRKQTHMHKLAIVLAAAQRDKLIIEKDDLILADKLLTSIEPDMLKVFEAVGMVDQAKHIATITSHVKAYGWIEVNTLYRLLMNNMTQRDFKEALTIAVTQRLIRPEQRATTQGMQNGLASLLPPTIH
jgi:Protein of unknown function (DUF3987)